MKLTCEEADKGVGGSASSSDSCLCADSSHTLPLLRRYSGLSPGLSSGLSIGKPERSLALLFRVGKSIFAPPDTREKITSARQRSRRTDCTMDMRFWNTTSSARIFKRELIARISRRDSALWLSRDITVLCQISSHCCLKWRSSSSTVLFKVSRKVVVLESCFFSTLVNASRRMRDCSSMYFRDRVEFVSRKLRRRETALKKDSWIVGREEVDEDVAVVLLRGWVELWSFWVVAVGGGEIGVSDVEVVLETAAVEESLNVESCAVTESVLWIVVDLISGADASEAGTGL